MLENLLILIIFGTLLISIFLFLNYQQFKENESNKLCLLKNMIDFEKNKNLILNENSKELVQLEKKTAQKWIHLRSLIFNLDFSLTEIFT